MGYTYAVACCYGDGGILMIQHLLYRRWGGGGRRCPIRLITYKIREAVLVYLLGWMVCTPGLCIR